MIDMTMTKAEAREDYGLVSPSSSDDDLPKYPYCLSLTLDEDVMKKLGIDAYPVGSVCSISAIAKVQSVSSDDTESGGKTQRMTLQITDMDPPTVAPSGEMADRMYSKGA